MIIVAGGGERGGKRSTAMSVSWKIEDRIKMMITVNDDNGI